MLLSSSRRSPFFVRIQFDWNIGNVRRSRILLGCFQRQEQSDRRRGGQTKKSPHRWWTHSKSDLENGKNMTWKFIPEWKNWRQNHPTSLCYTAVTTLPILDAGLALGFCLLCYRCPVGLVGSLCIGNIWARCSHYKMVSFLFAIGEGTSLCLSLHALWFSHPTSLSISHSLIHAWTTD